MKISIKLLVFIALLGELSISCKKQWLDAKPQKSLVVPNSIADYQAILDNTSDGQGLNINQPSLDELGAADFYMTTASWSALQATERNTYTWASGDVYQGAVISDWNKPYSQIFSTNVVLEGMSTLTPANSSEQTALNNIKGAALFFRAYNHYTAAQLFCLPYNKNTASTDLGIPLRISSDVNIPSVRSSVQQTYDLIINDLKQARILLPVLLPNTTLYKFRPTITATNAMLARVYLSMENYDSAFVYADQCLQAYNSLIDYNTLTIPATSSAFGLSNNNPEVMLYMTMLFYSSFSTSRLIIDSTLYQTYNSNDLRQSAFFFINAGNRTYKGSYNGTTNFFGGLATDEMYLIRAECNARRGNTIPAMQDMNLLLVKRWKNNGSFVSLTATDANDALKKILVERRKELIFRGLRWTDLRRLNKDPQFAVTLTRNVNSQTYTLPPNDSRYVLPIPDNVIQLSGIQQNPR